MAHIQHGSTIKRWQINQGGEFINSNLMDILEGLGIVIEQSVPHQHQQNGQAKRAIRTIMEKAQCLCFTACLPQSWWEFCVNHTVHLINQTPMYSPHNLTFVVANSSHPCHIIFSTDVATLIFLGTLEVVRQFLREVSWMEVRFLEIYHPDH